MSDIGNKYAEREMNLFAMEEWPKVMGFLKKGFGIDEDDCKDIFQESFIILYANIQSGKLDDMTASLSTYFMSVCKNKAHEFLRKAARSVNIDDELSLSMMDGGIKTEKIEAILSLDDGDVAIQSRKEELVRSIVKELSYPCNELLWGFYRDNLSMKTLADMFNYSSESSAKVTKHRCCEKFRVRYNELCDKLF